MHGFDGMEDVAEGWKPCMESWCDEGNRVRVRVRVRVGLGSGFEAVRQGGPTLTLTLTLTRARARARARTLTRCDKGDKLFDGEKLNAGLWWWSASVVSQRNFNTYGKAGLVLAPSRTKVMCSFYSDFGTFDRGCATAGLRDSGAIVPFPPDKLRRMLKISNPNP